MHALLLFLTATALAAGGAKDNARADLDKLQGHWVMVAETVGGIEVPRDKLQGRKLEIQGNRYMFKSPATGGEKGTFHLDPGASPKGIDGTPGEGPHKGQTRHGLYEIQGDTLEFCVAPFGESRPSAFASKPNTQVILVTYQRAKP